MLRIRLLSVHRLVLLAGLANTFGDSVAQTVSDSIQLEQYVRDMKMSLIGEEIDVDLPPEEQDSLLSVLLFESRSSVENAGVVKSPDGAFTVFYVEGNSCGAYCNPIYAANLHSDDGKIVKEIEAAWVTAIHKLPDGKYLLLDESWARPASVFTVTCKSVLVFAIGDTSITEEPFVHLDPDKEETGFSFCHRYGDEVEVEPMLDYDPSEQTLRYRYSDNNFYPAGGDMIFVYNGTFRYKNGRFELEQECVDVRRAAEEDE